LKRQLVNPLGLLLAAAGAFSVCGAVCDWDWFINSRKARFWVAILGRNGARGFYAILGVALIIFGVLMAMGIIESTRR
jgi:hypothetical protein